MLNSEKKVTKHVKGRKIPDRTRKRGGEFITWIFFTTHAVSIRRSVADPN